MIIKCKFFKLIHTILRGRLFAIFQNKTHFAMFKLTPFSRNFICGMGKRFYGISGSTIGGTEEQQQQQQQQFDLNLRMQAIEEKCKRDSKFMIRNMKNKWIWPKCTLSEQYQKQMAQQNAKMEKLQQAFLESQEKMATRFNGNLNELERKLSVIQEQQRTTAIKLGNLKGNYWKRNYWNMLKRFTISPNGLEVNTYRPWLNICTAKGFPISPKRFGNDNFVGIGTILYYYEVNRMSSRSADADGLFYVGLSAGYVPKYILDIFRSSYIQLDDALYMCKLPDKWHNFELPNGTFKTRTELKGIGDVVGCGILFESKQKMSIFFTLNGILLGKQIPISPSVKCLYPSVSMSNVWMEGNFGDNPAKPFKYDIKKCPGLVLE